LRRLPPVCLWVVKRIITSLFSTLEGVTCECPDSASTATCWIVGIIVASLLLYTLRVLHVNDQPLPLPRLPPVCLWVVERVKSQYFVAFEVVYDQPLPLLRLPPVCLYVNDPSAWHAPPVCLLGC